MPIFNPYGSLTTQVSSGTTSTLFATSDTVAIGSVSAVIAPLDSGAVNRRSVTFTANGLGATIYGSNTAPTTAPQDGVSLGTVTAGSVLQDTAGYAYYWGVATTAGPGSLVAHVS